MPTQSKIDANLLEKFDSVYDTTHEDLAFWVRGEFLSAYPKTHLRDLTLRAYAIGHQRPTFCTMVEATTRSWANIQGATASKFGIYFGKTKSDAEKKYRFTRKFGKTRAAAFRAVKVALLDLVRSGAKKDLDFAAIDGNPLSQNFKAKILSLYYPDRFINVCSADHLEIFAVKLGFDEGLLSSEYQHCLLEAKLAHPDTREWQNPKFTAFLYNTYLDDEYTPTTTVKMPRKKAHRKVNFDDIQKERDAAGK